MSKEQGAHSVGKSNHPEASRRKENIPQHEDPKKTVKGLGGINPADEADDRNASTRHGVRANENDKRKESGAHDRGKSSHETAALRSDNLPPVIKARDLGKVVSGLSTKELYNEK